MSQLLDQMRAQIRTRHYSIRTENSYIQWARQYILFNRKKHPRDLGENEVGDFLTHLAVERKVSASTQNQAHSALLFLHNVVLDRPLEWMDDIVRAKRPERLPVVFTRQEIRAVLVRLDGARQLMAGLMYGSGLRLMECLRLRIKDVDFGQNHIVVRDGRGQKDRVTLLPVTLADPLKRQIE
jgi:integrase